MKYVRHLKPDLFSDTIKCVSIGRLPQTMIDFIVDKRPEYKNKLFTNNDILFWKDRIVHTELHKNDFMSDIEFETCFEDIPDIIANPDYISVHPKDGSISFIRDYLGHVSVAIKISSTGSMAFRTMYPITDAQLAHYMKKGFAWKYPNDL